jgi:hypothetical protein
VKLRDLVPVCLLAPVLGFVAVQALHAPDVTASTEEASIAPAVRSHHTPRLTRSEVTVVAPSDDVVAPAATTPAPATVVSSAGGTELKRDVEEIRKRIMLSDKGTYIDEMLLERDSSLARWPERIATPIRVWVGSAPTLGGWDAQFPDKVRDAFSEWSALGIPVKFTFVRDSADADVHVTWVDHFDTPISGKTLWARDRNWWIVSGNITLALHHNGGEALDQRAIHAIALHEVGHLLGLDHTLDTSNIMTAKVRVRELSDADRATIKLLYELPPGSVKG